MVLAQHSRPAARRASSPASERLSSVVIAAWAFVVVATLATIVARRVGASIDAMVLIGAVGGVLALSGLESGRAPATERSAWAATVAGFAALGADAVARAVGWDLPTSAVFVAGGALLAAVGQLLLNDDVHRHNPTVRLDIAWIGATFLATGFLVISPDDLDIDQRLVTAVIVAGLGCALCGSASMVHAANLRPGERSAVTALAVAVLIVATPRTVVLALDAVPTWFDALEPLLWLTALALLGVVVSAATISGDVGQYRSALLEQILVWVPLVVFILAYVGANTVFDPPTLVLAGVPPLIFIGVVLRLVAVVRTNAGLAGQLTQQLADHSEIERHLQFRANHDELTGLPNRALTIERLQTALDRSRRTGDRVAVLWVDLDRFKIVNDSMGHQTGDELLGKVAERISARAESSDTVGRLAGDEFVVIMADAGGSRPPTSAARQLIQDMSEPFEIGEAKIWMGASLGIALVSDAEDTPESLLRDANAAMHRAKAGGRGRYELFDQEMRDQLVTNMRIESSLRHAIERDELRVYYQAQVDAADRDLKAFEALVRWDRPSGQVGPDLFIPVAEETGLISEIGMWVLERACWDCQSWVRPDGSRPRVSVNVSGLQLASPLLVENVAATIERTGLDPDRLTLEITETTLVGDPDLARLRLVKLRELGIRIAVDDFGTGYSSLSYLREFPLDEVKLDKAFIEGLGIEDTSTKIIGSVVGLARDLGYEVVAEGVEEESQLEHLAQLGAHLAQGYLISRPLPAHDVPGLLTHGPLPARTH